MTSLLRSAKSGLTVVVVERSASIRSAIGEEIERLGIEVVDAGNGMEGWSAIQRTKPDAVIVGLETTGLSGMELLRRTRQRSGIPVFLHAAAPDVAAAVEVIRAGASDFFVFPKDLARLASRLGELNVRGAQERNAREMEQRIVGKSQGIRLVRERILAVSRLRVSVLVSGERGSGKSLVVSELARNARDTVSSFIEIRCSPERSSCQPKPQGIIHLDEVDRMNPHDQARWHGIIRASEEGNRDAPARVFASTSTDLIALARARSFNVLLAECLARIPIEIPPLRERREDIHGLAASLSGRIATRMGRGAVEITQPAIRELQAQTWPENVRQLEEVIGRLVAFAPDGRITKAHIQGVINENATGVAAIRRERVRKQREELLALLRDTEGNLAEAARRLRMSRSAIIYRAQKFGLLPRSS